MAHRRRRRPHRPGARRPARLPGPRRPDPPVPGRGRPRGAPGAGRRRRADRPRHPAVRDRGREHAAEALFHIQLPPNILLVGFQLTEADIRNPGRDVVVHALGEPDGAALRAGRGPRVPPPPPAAKRDDLTWDDFGVAFGAFLDVTTHAGIQFVGSARRHVPWGATSAEVAALLFQLPARAAFLGETMRHGEPLMADLDDDPHLDGGGATPSAMPSTATSRRRSPACATRVVSATRLRVGGDADALADADARIAALLVDRGRLVTSRAELHDRIAEVIERELGDEVALEGDVPARAAARARRGALDARPGRAAGADLPGRRARRGARRRPGRRRGRCRHEVLDGRVGRRRHRPALAGAAARPSASGGRRGSPTRCARRTSIARPAVPPEFPAVLASEGHQSVARTLPDRFFVRIEQDGAGSRRPPHPRRSPTSCRSGSPNIDQLEPLAVDDHDLPPIDESLRWLVDYGEAVRVGMALTVPLAAPGQAVRTGHRLRRPRCPRAGRRAPPVSSTCSASTASPTAPRWSPRARRRTTPSRRGPTGASGRRSPRRR